jgi:hypothetical protein
MRLTSRDVEILKTVHEYRIMRGDQIQALYFGSQSTASYRLSRLYQHGFLDRQFLPTLGGLASSPTLYTLGRVGANVVHQALDAGPENIKRPPGKKDLSPLFLEHLLKINDVRVAVTLAVRRNNYTLDVWLDEATLKSDYDRVSIQPSGGRRREVSLIPDSYFSLQVPQGKAKFFLEFDHGTMTNNRFKEKILAYKSYIASGQYYSRYQTHSLRVLTVTIGPKRLVNLKKTAEEADGGAVFWFTILEDMTGETILDIPIWKVAGSVENAILIPTA